METPPVATVRRHLALFVLLAAVLTIGTAGWGDLYNETDGQYGGAARVMASGGSWLVPENNAIPRLVKPPWLYWEIASSIKIFGESAFAVRLPGALALTVWTGITFLLGLRMGGLRQAWLAGLILLTSLGTFALGRIVMPEPTFAVGIAAALFCVLCGHDRPGGRRWWFLGFWFFAALASFTKGWHGLLYPLGITGLAAALCPTARPNLRGLISWQGVGLFLLINLPWYFYIESHYPSWLHNLVFTEQLGHIEGNETPATDFTNVPRWQFVLLHAAWFFPWSILTGVTVLVRGKTLFHHFRLRGIFSRVLVLVWAVVIFGSVLLTGQRQDYYAMTMWPAVALGMAWVLHQRIPRSAIATLAAGLGLGFVLSFFLAGVTTANETGTLAERATAWSTLAGFDPSVWQSLQTTAGFALGGALLATLIALYVPRLVLPALTGAGVCLALGAVSGTSIVSPYFSLASVADRIPKGTTVVYDGGIDTGSSLLFYDDNRILLLDQNPDEDFIVRKFGIGRDRFITTEELAKLWQSDEPVIFITETRRLPEWQTRFGPELQPFARCGTSILLKP